MEKTILDDDYLVDSQFFQDDLTRTERLKSMFLDHFIMTMIIGLIFIIPSEILKMIKPEINTEIFFFYHWHCTSIKTLLIQWAWGKELLIKL